MKNKVSCNTNFLCSKCLNQNKKTDMANLRSQRTKGNSLLEVIIALTILMISALGLITVFRSGGTKGLSFSSEHFTAMFLSQKIVEDINFRCRR